MWDVYIFCNHMRLLRFIRDAYLVDMMFPLSDDSRKHCRSSRQYGRNKFVVPQRGKYEKLAVKRPFKVKGQKRHMHSGEPV